MPIIATFPSSQAALGAEQRLLGAGLAVELIPVPRQIRSDCGFCLLVGPDDPEAVPAEGWAQALRDCGARELWRVLSPPTPPPLRKVKTYERIP